MQQFVEAVACAKAAFPKNSFFAFNVCLDAILHTSTSKILNLPFVKKNTRLSLDIRSGIQREVKIGKRELLCLQNAFPNPTLKIGGQAGQAAELASSLGTRCNIICACSSKHLFSFFSNPKLIYALCGKSAVRADKLKNQLQRFPIHYILEYCVRPDVRNRIIFSYDPCPIISSKSLHTGAQHFSHLFVGGFHLMSSAHEAMEACNFLKSLKAKNKKLKIFIELGDFQKKTVMEVIKKYAFPFAYCVGLNDEELFQLTYTHGIGAINKLPKSVVKILYHTPFTSFTFPKEQGDDLALLFARIVCSYKAKYGKNPTWTALFKYAQKATSLKISHPAITVGLGDTFSCAYFLASA
ncbi:MAG: ADP-dependent glucokinase/phosphofructokinase [Candidatus Anstonellales archaeon]